MESRIPELEHQNQELRKQNGILSHTCSAAEIEISDLKNQNAELLQKIKEY